ncbi:hypothetical protein SEA_SHAGRAT_87 [Rhodococcus phage Shagrat]|nr:hypothetical protein SEA_SHAGRAT_87 [Rhodococcus phage Shagrat]
MGHIADTVNEAIKDRLALVGGHVKDFDGLAEGVERELLQKYFPLALIREGLRIIDDSAEETVAEITNEDGTPLDPDYVRMFVTGCKSGTDCLREIIAIVQAGGTAILPSGDLLPSPTGEES